MVGGLPERTLRARRRSPQYQLGIADGSRRVDRRTDVGGQLDPSARPPVRIGPRHEDVVAVMSGRRRVVAHGGQRRAEQRGSLLMGVQVAGDFRRRDRGPPRGARMRWTGREPVPGFLDRPTSSGQCPSRSDVAACAPRRRQGVVERVAHQGVGERVPVDAVLDDKSGGHRRLERFQHCVLIGARQRGQCLAVDPAARTAASVSIATVGSGSRSTRRVRTSWTARGVSAAASSGPRPPRSAASRAYSTTKNGLPAVRSQSIATTSGVGIVVAQVGHDVGDGLRGQAGQGQA